MTEHDPIEQLERLGRSDVPTPDPVFADRLESKLRAEHAATTADPRRRVPAWLPRVLGAGLAATAAVVGLVALGGRDAGVPVTVVEDVSVAPAGGGADEPASPALATAVPEPAASSPTPTPTSTPAPSPTPTVPPVEPEDASLPAPDASAESPTVPAPTLTATPAAQSTAVLPSPTAPPTPTVKPTPQPTTPTQPTTAPTQPPATSTPTPMPTPTATEQPAPAPTTTPTPTTVPSPTALPSPTATAEPIAVELSCEARTSDSAVGVVCTWGQPVGVDSALRFEVLRSLNGSEAVVVATEPPGSTSYTDRRVSRGDEVTYLVQARDHNDRVVAASVRQIIQIPN